MGEMRAVLLSATKWQVGRDVVEFLRTGKNHVVNVAEK